MQSQDRWSGGDTSTQDASAPDERSREIIASVTRELHPVQAAVRRNTLFHDLSETELAQLASGATLRDYPKHAYVFHRGDTAQALCIVVSGVVEIVLERGDRASLSLSTCEAGDFFGEMALLDGSPRSASARALCDCQILAIDRAALAPTLFTRLLTRISSALAERLRKSDNMLSEMAERVSRAAYANVNSAVAVELESIRTLHRHTEQIATDPLARAERSAGEVMRRADDIAGDIQKRLDGAWSIVKRWVAPISALLLTILTWYGVSSVEKLRDKLGEFETMYNQAKDRSAELGKLVTASQQNVARLESSYRHAQALQETVGELRAIRDAVGYGRAIDTPELLRRAALNHEQAKREIRDRYLAHTEAGPQFEKYDASVVFEAVDTYVSLVLGGNDDNQLRLSRDERADLLTALSYVHGNLMDVHDPSQLGHAAQLYDRKVRDMLAFILEGADHPLRQHVIRQLADALQTSTSRRARESLALSLAQLGETNDRVETILSEMQRDPHPFCRASAALALSRLGDKKSYAALTNQLHQNPPAAAYPAALVLAELGPHALRDLAGKVGAKQDLANLQARVEEVLTSRTPKNCLEERYARHVVTCLQGSCDPKISEDESCPNYTTSQN